MRTNWVSLPSHLSTLVRATRGPAQEERCKSYTNCVAPGKKRVERKTGSTQDHGQAARDQEPQDVNKRPPLSAHAFLVTNRDLRHNVGIPEEVQPATSDTTWIYLRNRRTTNCVSDLGQVTVKGNAQIDPLKVKKYNGGLSSCGVGARRCLGRSPASSWVGRPAGGCPHLCSSFWEFALLTGDYAQKSHSGAFLINQQVSCLTGDTSSYEIPGVLRL